MRCTWHARKPRRVASAREQGALVAAALAYSLEVGTSRREAAHRALLDAASAYRRTRVGPDGVPLCEFCGERVQPSQVGVYRRAQGWAEVRAQGGTHALAVQQFTGEVACARCIGGLRRGVAPEQTSLLG